MSPEDPVDGNVAATRPPRLGVPGRRRLRVEIPIVLLVLASVGVGWWAVRSTDASRASAERADRHRAATRRDTRALEATRLATLRTIAELESTLARRTSERDAVATALYGVTDRLHEIREALNRETSGLQAVETRVGALGTCLQGVSGALNALAVGDNRTALTRLRAVGSDCEAAA